MQIEAEDRTSGQQTLQDSGQLSYARLPYFSALDGLRGLAVLAVLFFHAGFSWMRGGYLGVSTFFTLSGFLITSLLLAEVVGQGRIDLRQFWLRRFRRLMPAALACLALAGAFGVVAGDQVQKFHLLADVAATLAYLANWRFIFSEQRYADLFGAPSPVLHFWSLGIEEQFYLLYPLLVAGLVTAGILSVRKRPGPIGAGARETVRLDLRWLATVLLAITVGATALTRWAGFDETRVYFGSDTRAPELLVGALLAILLSPWRVGSRLTQPGTVSTIVAALGVPALAGTVLLWSYSAQTSRWLYEGGLTLYAVLSATVIAAATLSTGPLATLLSLSPLRHLGRISYGVYLYHWPIFLWLRQETDLTPGPRFVFGALIALAIAELSYRYVELPIRLGGRIFGFRPLRLAPAAVAVPIVLAVVAILIAPPLGIDLEETWKELDDLTAKEPPQPVEIPTGGCVQPFPPRLAFFGDSTAFLTSWGVAVHMRETGKGSFVHGTPSMGCSLSRAPQLRIMEVIHATGESCTDWQKHWHASIDANRPTVAVVQIGPGEIADRRIPGQAEWRAPGDPAFDEILRLEMLSAVDVLSSHGALVVWLTSPLIGKAQTNRDTVGYSANERMRLLNKMIKRLPEQTGARVVVVDLAGWLQSLGSAEDERLRPDGIHFTKQTAVEVAERWLGDAIVRAWWDHASDVEYSRWQAASSR